MAPVGLPDAELEWLERSGRPAPAHPRARAGAWPGSWHLHRSMTTQGDTPPKGCWPELAAAAVAAAKQAVPLATAAAKVGPGEYTVAACICIVYPDGTAAPLAVGLGTRCLGPEQSRSADGAAVADCHAEVLARRAFLRLVALEAAWLLGAGGAGKGAVLERSVADDCARLRLRAGARIVLWVSKAPCGDAAVTNLGDVGLPGAAEQGAGVSAKRPRQSFGGADAASSEPNMPPARSGAVPRAGWSGAKPVVELASTAEAAAATAAALRRGSASRLTELVRDPMCGEGGEEQRGGLVRTKAGRSDLPAGRRSRSMSCSDKLCRWRLVGLQGAVLAAVVGRVPLAGVVVSAAGMGAAVGGRLALSRALSGRVSAATACLQAAAKLGAEETGPAGPRVAEPRLAGAARWALSCDGTPPAIDSGEGGATGGWARGDDCSDIEGAYSDATGGVAVTGWQPKGTREYAEGVGCGEADKARSAAVVASEAAGAKADSRADKRGRDSALSPAATQLRSWGSGVAEMCLGRWPSMLAEAVTARVEEDEDEECLERLRWSLRDLVAKRRPGTPTPARGPVELPPAALMQGRGVASSGRGEVVSSAGTLQGRKPTASPDDLAPAVAPRRLSVLVRRVCSLAAVASGPKDDMVARLAWDVTTAATPEAQALAVPQSGFEGWLRGRKPHV